MFTCIKCEHYIICVYVCIYIYTHRHIEYKWAIVEAWIECPVLGGWSSLHFHKNLYSHFQQSHGLTVRSWPQVMTSIDGECFGESSPHGETSSFRLVNYGLIQPDPAWSNMIQRFWSIHRLPTCWGGRFMDFKSTCLQPDIRWSQGNVPKTTGNFT